MLFNENAKDNLNVFESKKERNLYYKFFAGYFCNDLISNWEERLTHLVSKVKNETKISNFVLDPNTTHISFDNYFNQIHKPSDGGEFADIFIMDWNNKMALAIEAKFTEDFGEKDFGVLDQDKDNGKNNYARIKKIREKGYFENIIQIILIAEPKKKELENRADSELYKLKIFNNSLDTNEKIILWTWKEMIDLCDEGKAKEYFKKHLSLLYDNWEYTINNGVLSRG
jgi:hypothetical protein